MSDETTWELAQHTRTKHELLRRYLAAWFPILAQSGHRRMIFVDGFAGPGIYTGGEPGSPIIALDTLVNHNMFKRFSNTQFTFFFVEKNVERHNMLEKEIAKFWRQYPRESPRNVRVKNLNEDFISAATQVVKIIRRTKQSVPAFIFIDPFGPSGIPMSIIHELLSLRKCEVLINFMYNSINRFITDKQPKNAQIFTELFGIDKSKYLSIVSLDDSNERKIYLRDLYLDSLRRVGGCEFADSFEIWDSIHGRTSYFLIFGTHDIKGIEKMKKVMWSLDTFAGEISTKGKAGQMQLAFDPDLSKLRIALLDQFRGRQATIEEINEFVIAKTSFIKTHTKVILNQLEKENMIACLTERKQRGVYPLGTVLKFETADSRLFDLTNLIRESI